MPLVLFVCTFELPPMDSQKPSDASRSPAKDDTTKTEIPKPPLRTKIPNGGLEAWIQVFGSFFLFFNG